MRLFLLILLTSCAVPHATNNPETLVYNFTTETPDGDWRLQNDTVMGGASESSFTITGEGHGRFTGHVSLENNGGFASIVHQLDEAVDLEGKSSFQLRVKGDGKNYTFRAKADPDQRHWHQAKFPTKTTEEWETIAIPFASMQAKFRGRNVDVPNFGGDRVAAIQLLIGNKEEQDFVIELDVIETL